MSEGLQQLADSGFKRILIIGSILKYRRSLAIALLKLLPKPAFAALDPAAGGLPDKQYAWSSIDLVFIDMSENKPQIRRWFFELANSLQLPPIIFVDNRATVDDAGDMVRAGASDYIDLTRLDTRRLFRALLMAVGEKTTRMQTGTRSDTGVGGEPLGNGLFQVIEDAGSPLGESPPEDIGMTDEPTEVLPVLTSAMLAAVQQEPAMKNDASFLTTGLLEIFDRDETKKLEGVKEVDEDATQKPTRATFLTTGLMSILERDQVLSEDLPQHSPPRAETFSTTRGEPFSSQQLQQGTAIVGDYKLLEFVAIGGSATVFKAQHKNSGDVLAIKLFDNEIGDEHGAERFLRGYQLIKQVKHPHIVSIKESGERDGYTFVAMEYFPGGELKQLIKGGVSRQQAVRYTMEIAEALNAAHQHNILHRDLKPSNVMMRDDGSLALLDFGIAKLMAEGQSELTQSDHVVGTSHYISPEQALGDKIDGRADLYALGVMLYEMLEGKRPYTGSSPIHIMQQHVRGPVPVLAGAKDPLNPIIARLMAKDPDDRYASGAEVISALSSAIPDLQAKILLKEVN